VISLILFLVTGALLFLALLYVIVRSPADWESVGDPMRAACHAVDALESGLLPAELVSRIFARDDLDYVTSCGSGDICGTFLRERSKIARSWVGMVEKQIVSLRRFHLLASRHHSGLSFRAEAGLALDFAALVLACRALQVLLYLRGPFAAPRVVGATVAAATRICEASKQSMAFLNSASITAVGHGPGGAPA
jgi:hypothetical protein